MWGGMSFTVPSPSVRKILRMESNAPARCPNKQGRIELRGEASSLEPAVHCDHIEPRIGSEGVFVNRSPTWPAIEDVGCGDLALHSRHIMTKLVISQRSQHGD